MASSTINDIQEENGNGVNNGQPLLANVDEVEYVMDCDIGDHVGSTTTCDFSNNETQGEFLLGQVALISQDVEEVIMETNPPTMAEISNTVQENQNNVQDISWSIQKGKVLIFLV